MTIPVQLSPTRCAICGTPSNASVIYPANFELGAFHPSVFSARRLPDRIHYQMVKCRSCGLVRSDPIADRSTIQDLYVRSSFDYVDEVRDLQSTYGRYLATLGRYGVTKGSLLEIGCGSGFFLEEALAQGYPSVTGVEPSVAAVAKASALIHPHLICDIMRPGLFSPACFDVICLFQVFDHLPDPAVVLDECLHVLKSGGFVLCICHNIDALSSLVLRERSPIVDIEHTYLFSPQTIAQIFQLHGFQVRHVGRVWNDYTLRYLARLFPFPPTVKSQVLNRLSRSNIGRLRVTVPLGNLCVVAQKPTSAA